MPVDANLHCTDVVSPGCELKGLRTWKDICLVRNSLFQHQVCSNLTKEAWDMFKEKCAFKAINSLLCLV